MKTFLTSLAVAALYIGFSYSLYVGETGITNILSTIIILISFAGLIAVTGTVYVFTGNTDLIPEVHEALKTKNKVVNAIATVIQYGTAFYAIYMGAIFTGTLLLVALIAMFTFKKFTAVLTSKLA